MHTVREYCAYVAADGADKTIPQPAWTPVLRTGRAAGLDGVNADMLQQLPLRVQRADDRLSLQTVYYNRRKGKTICI